MNRRPLAIVCLAALVVVLSAVAVSTRAQRSRNRGVVHNMEATADKAGAHPDKFALTAPALITCVRATSEIPDSNPAPACRISANGFNGTMAANSNATLKAGDITLSCVGQGPMLRCDARVDIPPPATPPSQ
jgi:hypothetical protein